MTSAGHATPHDAFLDLTLHAPNSDVPVKVASLFEGRKLVHVAAIIFPPFDAPIM